MIALLCDKKILYSLNTRYLLGEICQFDKRINSKNKIEVTRLGFHEKMQHFFVFQHNSYILHTPSCNDIDILLTRYIMLVIP